MRLLLDTHVLIWALLDPDRLDARVAAMLADPDNEVVASAVSAWEIALKQSLGKLELPGPAETWLLAAVEAVGVHWLDVTPEHAVRVRSLPWHHRDPFDRLLVSQAMDGWRLVTRDTQLSAYGVAVLET